MEGVPPSFMEDDVNQLDFETLMSELPSSPPEEFPVNQSSISCNDQAGQNLLVNINDTIQQTTRFPPSFPQTMMEGAPSSSVEDDVNLTSNQLDFETFNMSELSWLPPEEVPVNQSSMLCNDQAGQNMLVDNDVINDCIQQTTQFPPSFPQTMMEGAPPSSVEDDVNSTSNRLELEKLMSGHPSWPPEEVPVNQSSILCNDEAGQNMLVDNNVINDSFQQTTQFPPSFPDQTMTNKQLLEGTSSSWINQNCPQTLSRHQNSFIHQPQPGNVQKEALKAMRGGNKRHKSTASSINVNDRGISTCLQEQNIENENMGGDIGWVQREVQVVETGLGEERISSYAVAGNNVVSMTGMRAQEDRVSEGALESRLMTEPVDRALEQSVGTEPVGVQVMEQGAREERIQSHSQAQNAMEDTGEESLGHDAFQTIPREEQVQHLDRGSSCERLSINPADEPRGDSSQPTDPLCLDHGRYYDQPFARVADVIMNDVQSMVRVRAEPVEEHDVENSGRLVQPRAGARSLENLKYSKSRGVPFPTSSSKPVGQAFEENTNVIWSLLMDDEVSTIGIYGMGGAGKTTLLQHIHNELIRRTDICDHVWWVSVPQDFNIYRLQNFIAKRLDLDLSSEDDDQHRAAKLSEQLRKKQKWILILDDLWDSFERQDVGIHSSLKGCKLILTTRSQTVCDQIDCQQKIKVKPLSESEAWTLFRENLGFHKALSPEVEGIAEAVARECGGLPLGIVTVARSLRGVDNLNKWRNTLKELRESGYRDMNQKVLKVLRFSYDRLYDGLALQKCLLYCALFPKDDRISRNELIGYLIDEGIIKGMRSWQDAFDKGHTILNELEYVCLLESGCNFVKMHDLVRDMAIQILQANSQVIVKAGAQLEELPNAEEWTENLTRVSLMKNQIKEIPSSHSPMCPNLSTLFLCDNRQLGFIADSFFKQLHGLRVLDLSRTGIVKLPDSVSDLVSLTVLLLIECLRLRDVPSLEKLTELKRLDLSKTGLEKMPQGMECLTKLTYLRMNRCDEKEFPSGILPKLSHLQVLALGEVRTKCCTVEGREVGCLGKLETLECHFEVFSDFVEYLTSRDGIHSLSAYKISVGTLNGDNWAHGHVFPSKTVFLGNLSINRDRDFQVKFLNGIQGLVCEFIDARSLCDVLSLENATELESIRIQGCNSMESSVSSSWFSSAPSPLPSHNGMFSCLKEFYCDGCDNMENLFPLELLSYLVNLEVIRVSYCEKMEEIIGTTDEENSTSNPIAELTLPKLTTLELSDLPELKGICSAKLICNSLENIYVTNCKKLKRMAISLPLLENGQPSPHPSLQRIKVCPEEWWETVEWEPPHAKEVLRPIVHFDEEEYFED